MNKHILNSKETIHFYNKGSIGLAESLNTVSEGNYFFDNNKGIGKVHTSNTKSLDITYPISNLEIGDRIRAFVDIKLLNKRESLPQLVSAWADEKGNMNTSGDFGIQKYQHSSTREINGFQRLEINFIYTGVNNETTLNPNNSGLSFIRLLSPSGYGPSEFLFKNFTIESKSSIGGLSKGTSIFYSNFLLENNLLKNFENSGGNIRNFIEIEILTDSINLNFKRNFTKIPTIFISKQYTSSAKNYKIKYSSLSNSQIKLVIINKDTNEKINIDSVSDKLYFNIIIIGE